MKIGTTIAAPTKMTLKSFENAENPIDHSDVKKWTTFQMTSIGVQPSKVITIPTSKENITSLIKTRAGVSPRIELKGFDIIFLG